ncbi:DUF5082 family protein [Lentibacillus sp. N15]|uniref:YwqH-like family protein n=1 Tax=Lentibacillus songyuanensis TaxID=3136161 RepID=UPI0031BAD439
MDYSFQINQLSNEISGFNSTIQANNEKINRLKDSSTKIVGDQDELSMQKGAVNQPELSSETWRGNYADDFLDKQESLKQEYNNIKNTETERLLDNISDAIQRLKNANTDLSDSIESNRHRIRQLRAMEDDD